MKILSIIFLFSIFSQSAIALTPDVASYFDNLRKANLEIDHSSVALLNFAEANWVSDPFNAQLALTSFVSRNRVAELSDEKNIRNGAKPSLEGIPRDEILRFAIESSPELAQKQYSGILRSMAFALERIHVAVKEQKVRSWEKLVRKLNPALSNDLTVATERAARSLRSLAFYVRNADVDTLFNFYQNKSELFILFHGLAESQTQRWATAKNWSGEIETGAWRFRQTGHFFKGRAGDYGKKLAAYLEKEKDIEIFRTYVNQDTVTTSALAGLLVLEGVCTVVTLGACGGSIPVTVGVMTQVGRVTIAVTRGVVVANAGTNILDRYRFEGAQGVLQIGTVIDALMILTLLPRPSLGMLSSSRVFGVLGKSVEVSKVWGKVARAQQVSAWGLVGLAGGYGSYQIVRADFISERYKKRGFDISPAEVRLQGATNIAIGMLGGFKSYQAHRQTLSKSSQYQSQFDKSFLEYQRQGMVRSVQRMNPIHSLRNVKSGISQGAPFTAIKGIASLGFQYVWYGSMGLMLYSNPDFRFMKNVKPFPDLEEGESALLMNGFHPTDILYHAFSSEQANQAELEKYGADVRLDFFNTRTLLFDSLRRHAKKNGPIKYLKIMAHGSPGHLWPSTEDITGGGNNPVAINTSYFEDNRDWLRQLGKEVFAPDAEIVLFSCLVGAQLEKPVSHKGLTYRVDEGDRFIKIMGETLLQNHGKIHSSRMIISGVTGAAAPAVHYFMNQEIESKSAEKQAFIKDEFEKLSRDIEEFNVLAKRSQDIAKKYQATPAPPPTPKLSGGNLGQARETPYLQDSEEVEWPELIQTMTQRFLQISYKTWWINYQFGKNIDGGFFDPRTRTDSF